MANLMLGYLRQVFSRAVRWGVIDADPTRDLAPFPTKARSRLITEQEREAIRAQASPTLACLMDLAYLTGQRIGDLIRIRYADIGVDELAITQQKTGNRLRIELNEDIRAAIAAARGLHQSVKAMTLFHRPDGRLLAYRTLYDHWTEACRLAGVTDAHFHDLRACAATDARAQGLDSKALLGHRSDSSHQRYLRAKTVPLATPLKRRS